MDISFAVRSIEEFSSESRFPALFWGACPEADCFTTVIVIGFEICLLPFAVTTAEGIVNVPILVASKINE